MTTKVYALILNDWEDTETVGIFSTLDYAEIAKSLFSPYYQDNISIIEYELDVPPSVKEIQERHY